MKSCREVFEGKVIVRVYKLIEMPNLGMDYIGEPKRIGDTVQMAPERWRPWKTWDTLTLSRGLFVLNTNPIESVDILAGELAVKILTDIRGVFKFKPSYFAAAFVEHDSFPDCESTLAWGVA